MPSQETEAAALPHNDSSMSREPWEQPEDEGHQALKIAAFKKVGQLCLIPSSDSPLVCDPRSP